MPSFGERRGRGRSGEQLLPFVCQSLELLSRRSLSNHFLTLTSPSTIRKFASRFWPWGVRRSAHSAGLQLLTLIFSAYVFVLTPFINTVTRVTAREADAFGINTCREPDGAAMVALKLREYRKLDPGPIEEFIFFDHPSGRARIRMAMDWKAARLPAGE